LIFGVPKIQCGSEPARESDSTKNLTPYASAISNIRGKSSGTRNRSTAAKNHRSCATGPSVRAISTPIEFFSSVVALLM
jgi:hypothetical protein